MSIQTKENLFIKIPSNLKMEIEIESVQAKTNLTKLVTLLLEHRHSIEIYEQFLVSSLATHKLKLKSKDKQNDISN